MNREACLKAAAECVLKDRNATYGPPEDNFLRIARLWSAVLGVQVSTVQVALCMTCVKVARLACTPTHQDSWVDLAGYAACGAELSDAEHTEAGAHGEDAEA